MVGLIMLIDPINNARGAIFCQVESRRNIGQASLGNTWGTQKCRGNAPNFKVIMARMRVLLADRGINGLMKVMARKPNAALDCKIKYFIVPSCAGARRSRLIRPRTATRLRTSPAHTRIHSEVVSTNIVPMTAHSHATGRQEKVWRRIVYCGRILITVD